MFICRKQGENCSFFKGYGRGIVSMVEQWSPKPEVKGSNPFSPDLFIWLFSVLTPPLLFKKTDSHAFFIWCFLFYKKHQIKKQSFSGFTDLYYKNHFLCVDLFFAQLRVMPTLRLTLTLFLGGISGLFSFF